MGEQRDPWAEIEQWKKDYFALERSDAQLYKEKEELLLRATRAEALLAALADHLIKSKA